MSFFYENRKKTVRIKRAAAIGHLLQYRERIPMDNAGLVVGIITAIFKNVA